MSSLPLSINCAQRHYQSLKNRDGALRNLVEFDFAIRIEGKMLREVSHTLADAPALLGCQESCTNIVKYAESEPLSAWFGNCQ